MKKTAFEKYGRLKVTGNQLTDLNENTVMLRGISSHALSWYPEYVNEEFLLQARDEWKIDLFRLAMYTDEEDGYCVGDDANREKMKQVVKKGVALAAKLGIYVMVDWHILKDYNPLMHLEQSKLFWDEMAAYCNQFDNVIYEICNEPNMDTSWADVKTYAEQIIPIIRKHDQKAVILVGTPVWSQRVDEAMNDPVEGENNLMYVLHFYADTHRDELRNRMIDCHEKGLPIFVSEFGTMDASGNGPVNYEQSKLWIDAMEQEKISYCIWNISNKDETSAFFKKECSKVDGFTREDMTENGLWYLNVLENKQSV